MGIEYDGLKIGYVMSGSFCTFDKAFEQAMILKLNGAEILPIMSFNASSIDSRFGTATKHKDEFEKICQKKPIVTIEDAEPIGPKNLTDILVVAPCTGNTLAKLANSITDTPATMAVKSHIRNARPVVICLATNDGLNGSAKNLGLLMSMKNFYFVPMTQDDSLNKPTSLVANFSLIPETVSMAISGKQLQPMIF